MAVGANHRPSQNRCLRRGRRPTAASPLPGFLLVLSLFLFLPCCCALRLCTDSRAPLSLKTPLSFCSYNGSSCCNTTDDGAIEQQFKSMSVSDPACAAVVKSVLCAKCDPYSADLFHNAQKIQKVPLLCNSTDSASSTRTKDTTKGFCSEVWNTCKNISIKNSPFAALPASSSKLTDLWQSESDFCATFGGSSGDESLCFDGQSVLFNTTSNPPAPKGVCLEKISKESYLNMVAHPDGSDRAFFSNQPGKVWLATLPEDGSGGMLELDESNPFLDLTDEVHYDIEFGMMGLAFHPDFAKNGRLFVSYNCDRVKSPSCSGRCSCNSDVSCDPSKIGSEDGALPCQFQSVIAEYSANGSSVSPSMATSANPSEVRRIFTMGLPFTSHHGGQILFGPADGYMYFMMGDGGSKGDPYNFAQNKKSLLGKIMRFDINSIPSQSVIDDLGLWGNYSVPKDNPYTDDSELQAEIWALGLRNPWRCSFDAERPSYFFCADVGQENYEEVDLITKGGNYGWRVYEGPEIYQPSSTPGGNTSINSINAIPPIMGYSHSDVNKKEGSASITGGYVYRSATDPCLYGRYLYMDLYALSMWDGTEQPENSGNYNSTLIEFSCAKESPIPCDTLSGSPLPSLGYIYSFGQDNRKDVYLLTSKGVYRIVRPSRCGYVCPLETKAETPTSPPGSSTAWRLVSLPGSLLIVTVAAFLLLNSL